VLPLAQHLHTLDQGLAVDQQVGKDRHQAPRGQVLGHLLQDREDIGLFPGLVVGQSGHDRVEVPGLAARWQDGADGRVEGDQPHRVLLAQQQPGRAGCRGGRIFALGHRARTVAHRFGDIHHQRAAKVGLGLELLDVEPVGLRPDLPVQVPDVVPGGVFPVLDELDGVAEEGRGMHPRQKPLNRLVGAQFQSADPGQHGRVEKSPRILVVFVALGHSPDPAVGLDYRLRIRPRKWASGARPATDRFPCRGSRGPNG